MGPLWNAAGLTPSRFLARHWQKRPLLVRRAFPDFRDPLTPDELAGLACEDDVESRLVLERGGERPWQVVAGPQDARRLRRLGPTHWTLLVQGANRHVPALAELLDAFAFVPTWRIDDVMVSLAPRSGTVGPHVDRYDVFLLQGRGRRRWQIATSFDDALVPGLDLRVLRRFRAEREWVLEPGDMLYLPPGVAHFGVALDTCLTYSIGFRAPSHAALVLGCLERLVAGIDRDRLYGDPDLAPQRHPGAIAASARREIRTIVTRAVRGLRGRALDRFVGEILTERGEPAPPRRPVAAGDVARRVRAGAGLERSATTRVAFMRHGRVATLFVDGRSYDLPRSLAFAAPLLSGARSVAAGDLRSGLTRRGFADLMADLVNAGAFRLAPAPRSAAPRAAGGNRRGTRSRRRAARRSAGAGAPAGARGA